MAGSLAKGFAGRCRRAGGDVLAGLLDLVYPPSCLVCREEPRDGGERQLCRACSASLPRLDGLSCPGCGSAPAGNPSDFCRRCRGECHRDGLVAALEYTGAARDLVRSFKYGGDLAVGDLLSDLLVEAAGLAGLPRPDTVVPVPLHRRRLAERGFNQAAILARSLARREKMIFMPRALRRRRPTEPLAGLGAAARRRELRGAFSARTTSGIRGRVVLLVDDVVTTGSTAEECSRILKAAGARKVFVAAAARRLRRRGFH